jgi:hypothetical protein
MTADGCWQRERNWNEENANTAELIFNQDMEELHCKEMNTQDPSVIQTQIITEAISKLRF